MDKRGRTKIVKKFSFLLLVCAVIVVLFANLAYKKKGKETGKTD